MSGFLCDDSKVPISKADSLNDSCRWASVDEEVRTAVQGEALSGTPCRMGVLGADSSELAQPAVALGLLVEMDELRVVPDTTLAVMTQLRAMVDNPSSPDWIICTDPALWGLCIVAVSHCVSSDAWKLEFLWPGWNQPEEIDWLSFANTQFEENQTFPHGVQWSRKAPCRHFSDVLRIQHDERTTMPVRFENYTDGAMLDFFFMKVTAGFYDVELGSTYQQVQGKRFILYLSLFDFTFDA